MSALKRVARLMVVLEAVTLPVSLAWGQLNENCTASALNRTVVITPEGSFEIPNIPSDVTAGERAATSQQIKVATKDVTVVAWIDGDLIVLPGSANAVLRANLVPATPFCVGQLLQWVLGRRTNVFDEADRKYANWFLLKFSANRFSVNGVPPATIDPKQVGSSRDYRLFNRLQVFFRVEGGRVVGEPQLVGSPAADVGPTPDPCGLSGTLLGTTDRHFLNGRSGKTQSETGVFQLNEGRLGSNGQKVNATLNWCTTFNCADVPASAVTPWIWSVIRFDAQGRLSPVDHQIFPNYATYENGRLVSTRLHGSPDPFISLDSRSQRLPQDIP